MQVGNTPLVEVEGIFAKLECLNPSGSIKDRIVQFILFRSIASGDLKPGMKIVEATSGNTGIALAFFGKKLGYEVHVVMPENMTEERKELIRSFGAKLILCSEEGSFAEAAQLRDEIAQDPSYFNPDQFSNPLNVECHRTTTGREILDSLPSHRAPVAFVAGVGTGGTLIGVGRTLREKFAGTKVIAVEPSESAVMSGGEPHSHGIYGIGDGFIPAIAGNGSGGLHPLIDEVMTVRSAEALDAARHLRDAHGLCVGVSSGANFVAAKRARDRYGSAVTVFSDGYAKYASCGLLRAESPPCQFSDLCAAGAATRLKAIEQNGPGAKAAPSPLAN